MVRSRAFALAVMLVAAGVGLGGSFLVGPGQPITPTKPTEPPRSAPLVSLAKVERPAATPAMARVGRSRVDWARFEREGFRREFARFLARAGLTPAQEDEFLDLVLGESRLHAEREAKVRSGEIKTLQDLIAFLGPRRAQFEDRLRELLGDDLYREYRTAAMRIPLERSLKIYAAIAARHDAGFSAAQLDLVTDSMLEAYLANGATPLFNPFESMISDSRYFAEIMARKKAFAEVIQQVGPVLGANQRAALQKYQDQQILGWLAHRSGKLPVTMSGGS